MLSIFIESVCYLFSLSRFAIYDNLIVSNISCSKQVMSFEKHLSFLDFHIFLDHDGYVSRSSLLQTRHQGQRAHFQWAALSVHQTPRSLLPKCSSQKVFATQRKCWCSHVRYYRLGTFTTAAQAKGRS